MNIQAVVWDMGGVLLRTEDPKLRSELAARLGYSRAELEGIVFNSKTSRLASMGKISPQAHWEATMKSLNLPEGDAGLFQKEFWGGDRMDQELIAYIRKIKTRGKTGLLSNAWSDGREIAGRFGILDAFDVAIFSAEAGLVKPQREIYDLCLHTLDTDPLQTLFIDDMPENVDGARAAGWQAIQFLGRNQLLTELQAFQPG